MSATMEKESEVLDGRGRLVGHTCRDDGVAWYIPDGPKAYDSHFLRKLADELDRLNR